MSDEISGDAIDTGTVDASAANTNTTIDAATIAEGASPSTTSTQPTTTNSQTNDSQQEGNPLPAQSLIDAVAAVKDKANTLGGYVVGSLAPHMDDIDGLIPVAADNKDLALQKVSFLGEAVTLLGSFVEYELIGLINTLKAEITSL